MTTPCSLNSCPFSVISQVGRGREAQEDSGQHIPHLLLVEQQCPGCSSTTAGLFHATESLGSGVKCCVTGQQQETHHNSAASTESPSYLPKRERQKYHSIPVHTVLWNGKTPVTRSCLCSSQQSLCAKLTPFHLTVPVCHTDRVAPDIPLCATLTVFLLTVPCALN